jgi:hypothetical protein
MSKCSFTRVVNTCAMLFDYCGIERVLTVPGVELADIPLTLAINAGKVSTPAKYVAWLSFQCNLVWTIRTVKKVRRSNGCCYPQCGRHESY